MKKIYSLLVSVGFLFSFTLHSQCSTPSGVPYNEGFQGITSPNQLPVCWAISNASTCITFTAPGSGNGAGFYYMPAGSSYFYSKGVQLNTGIVYSVSVHYITSVNAASWPEFSILLNTGQNATGATTLASVSSPITGNVITSLSNTFTVSNAGVYFFAIKGTSNGSSATPYLSWDDLSVTIPCNGTSNQPTVNIVSSASFVCSGQPAGQLVLMANGADTYTWSTGANTQTISNSPTSPGSNSYSVAGTNTLTGCTNTASITIAVNPAPSIAVVSNTNQVCKGSSAILTALGAPNYLWSTGDQTNTISVTPSVSTNYSVVGTNAYGCSGSAVANIQVNPLPNILVTNAVASNTICNGDSDTLTATGATSYTWSNTQTLQFGSQIIVNPNVTTNYLVTGMGASGCSSQTSFVLNVNACTGLNNLGANTIELKILPNPFHDEFLLKTGNMELKNIQITDLSGRSVLNINSEEEKIIINAKYYAQGIYYIRVSSSSRTDLLKVIKN